MRDSSNRKKFTRKEMVTKRVADFQESPPHGELRETRGETTKRVADFQESTESAYRIYLYSTTCMASQIRLAHASKSIFSDKAFTSPKRAWVSGLSGRKSVQQSAHA